MNAFTSIASPIERIRQHFTGHILATIRNACKGSGVTIHYGHQNGAYGVHQCLVKLEGDDRNYRLILAPEDAPIMIAYRDADEHFGVRLGDAA